MSDSTISNHGSVSIVCQGCGILLLRLRLKNAAELSWVAWIRRWFSETSNTFGNLGQNMAIAFPAEQKAYWRALTVVIAVAIPLFLGIHHWIGIQIPNSPRLEVLFTMAAPLVLGSASILITMNTRHTSIADRLRSLTEFRYRLRTAQAVAPPRRASATSRQIKWFSIRYQLTLVAVLCIYMSAVTLVPAFLQQPRIDESPAVGSDALQFRALPLSDSAWWYFRCSLAAFAVGTISAMFDMVLSLFTLANAFEATSEATANEAKISPDIATANTAMLTSFMSKYDLVAEELEKYRSPSAKQNLHEIFTL